ncbi:MAG: PulJ/GspJ family protein [Synechococcus sp.]
MTIHPSPHPQTPTPAAGFTLVELLLAIGLGTLLCGVLLQTLLGGFRITTAMAQRLHARRQQHQVLSLIGDERAMGHGAIANPVPSPTWPCSLAGRRPVLAIALSASDPDARHQAIIYSVGTAPSPIWRGQVLMRCGPAYGLNGRINPTSKFQNRVLLDGLPSGHNQGLQATVDPQLAVIDLSLEQQLPVKSWHRNNQAARLTSTATI